MEDKQRAAAATVAAAAVDDETAIGSRCRGHYPREKNMAPAPR